MKINEVDYRAVGRPGVPSGFVVRSSGDGLRLSWVASVDPVSCVDASGYTVHRSTKAGGPYWDVALGLKSPGFLDKTAKKGRLYHYVVTAVNEVGASGQSAEIAANVGLPGPWLTGDIGKISVPGYTEYNGKVFTLEGEGHDIGGKADEFSADCGSPSPMR